MTLRAASFKNSARLKSAAENSPPMRAGETGPGVSLLQLALAALGYSMPKTMAFIVPDGHFGPETSAAVTAFQREQRLTVDCVVGHATLKRLDEMFIDRDRLPQPTFPRPPTLKNSLGNRRGRCKPPGADVTFIGPGARLQLGFGLKASAETAPGNATIVSPPSPDWVEIGRSSWYKVGVNGPDKDLGFNDLKFSDCHPPLGMGLVYEIAVELPDSTLASTWRGTFANVYGTGPLGQQMIDRFMNGTGGSLVHSHGSDLSNTAYNTLTFTTARVEVRAEIQRQLKAQLGTGQIDWRKLSIVVNIPFSTFTDDLTVPARFRAMIGGIHGTKLFARNFRILGDNPVDQVWSATFELKYEMGDHFGVGKDDLYSPDLIAMNVLQHQRAGHKPFLNFIEVEDALTVLIQ